MPSYGHLVIIVSRNKLIDQTIGPKGSAPEISLAPGRTHATLSLRSGASTTFLHDREKISALHLPFFSMASGAVVRPLASISAAIGFRQVVRRGISTATKGNQLKNQLQSGLKRSSVQLPKHSIRQNFRRGYADQPVVTEKTKKRSWGFLRWTWRLTYLSAIGGAAYMGWGIYQSKHPADQQEPDPNKKTLVVLGMA